MLFALMVANKQRAGKKGKKPQPIARPKSKTERRFNTVMTLDELDAFLGWKSPRSRE